MKDGRVATLTSRNGLPCDSVEWTIEDDDRSLWLGLPCGLARVARSELDAWAAEVNKAQPLPHGRGSEAAGSGYTIHPTVFDASDGARMNAGANGNNPLVAKSSDGRLWFAVQGGIGVVNPRHLPFNKLPPPVEIEQINADRKMYETTSNRNLRLPPRTRDLQIDYTALSFADPEKIRFKFKLEGEDSYWHEVGNRRQAFYNDLPPRHYRFRVMASNNSGVWNEAGAALDFSIDPVFYQTRWFQASSVAAFLAVLAGLYQLRQRQVARRITIRMEERINERTRIARDLHDTILQSFQGVLLKFYAVTYLLPDHPTEAGKTLQGVIEQAREAIAEGRDAVQGLRSSTIVTNELAQAITTFGEALVTDQPGQKSPEFRVLVEGAPRDLPPILRDEVYRIAGESLRNAFRHAQARRIEVEIRYDRRQLQVRVRDDGKGIDPQVLSEGGRAGHHGLPGMQERARLLGGKLNVWSELNSGTEIELTISAAVAYAKAPAAPQPVPSVQETR